jgi:hypothetical protein
VSVHDCPLVLRQERLAGKNQFWRNRFGRKIAEQRRAEGFLCGYWIRDLPFREVEEILPPVRKREMREYSSGCRCRSIIDSGNLPAV